MADNIDATTIQKILTISSDLIYEKVAPLIPAKDELSKRLIIVQPKDTSVGKKIYNSEEVNKILLQQTQLSTGYPLPNGEIAHRIFSSFLDTEAEKTYNVPQIQKINSPTTTQDAIISWKIFIFVKGKYYFVPLHYYNTDYGGGKNNQLKFTGIEIENNSSDSYTNKSSYVITLKLSFTEYEFLTRKNLYFFPISDIDKTESQLSALLDEAKTMNPSDPAVKGIFISPLNLIYKFYDPNLGTTVSRESGEIQDHDGFFIQQTLSVPKLAADFTRAFGSDKIRKTYHVTYYKHSFEFFKNEQIVKTNLKNAVNISYVAYETDLGEKAYSSPGLPKYSSNLYNIISVKEYANDEISKWMNIPVYTELKDKVEKYSSEIELYTKQMIAAGNNLTSDQRERVVGVINERKKELAALRARLKNYILTIMINSFAFYKMQIPFKAINSWSELDEIENFVNNFSIANFASAASTGAIFGGWGAIVGASSYLLFEAINAATQKKYKFQEVKAIDIRSAISQALSVKEIVKEATDGAHSAFVTLYRSKILDKMRTAAASKIIWFVPTQPDGERFKQILEETGLLNSEGVFSMAGLGSEATPADREKIDAALRKFFEHISANTIEKQKEILDAIIVGMGQKPAEDKAEAQAQDEAARTSIDTSYPYEIKFILFKDIIKVLCALDPTKRTKILCFNHFFQIDSGDGGKFVTINLAYLPVSFELFLTWFQKSFINSSNTDKYYDSELFFKDAFENLVKIALEDAQSAYSIASNSVPRNLKLNTSIHDETKLTNMNTMTGLPAEWFALEDNYEMISAELTKSRSFSPATTTLCKVLTISSSQDVKYFNYYEDYRKYIDSLSTAGVKKASKQKLQYTYNYLFERYINIKHLLPCVVLNDANEAHTFMRKKYVDFRKMDNPNIQTGNIIDGGSIFRGQYDGTITCYPYMSLFVDVGNLIFVAPPFTPSPFEFDGEEITEASIVRRVNLTNSVGFGGLYFIKNTKLIFNLLSADGRTVAGEDANYTLNISMISYGENAARGRDTRPGSRILPGARLPELEALFEPGIRIEAENPAAPGR